MRRRVGILGIPVRSAVAVALPLIGAMYLAERSGDPRLAGTGRVIERSPGSPTSRVIAVIGSSSPESSSVPAQDPETSNGSVEPALANATSAPTRSSNQDNELSAEQQAEQGDRGIGSSDHRVIGSSTPESAKVLAQKQAQAPAKDAHVRQIVISIPDRRLALLVDGELVKVYPVAVGRSETPSPDGEYSIINHAANPTYRHEGAEIGPGKDNPLGTRWMGLSLKGYGIHGTNVQRSVGKAASHGCFRMKKKDVEDLYGRVRVGDAVTIRGERDELTAGLFTNPAQGIGDRGQGTGDRIASAEQPAGAAPGIGDRGQGTGDSGRGTAAAEQDPQ